MEYVKLLIILIFLFYVLCLNISLAQLEEDNCYGAVFTEGTKDCSDFENKVFICTLNIEISSENNEGQSGMVLSGEMKLMEDLGEEYNVELNVWKDIGTGKQYMYNIEGNLCDSLKKNDTPWKPLAEAFAKEGTSGCPIAKGVYTVENMIISLDFAEKVINHEFCGEYVVDVSIKTLENTISCYEIGLAVEEVPCK